MTSDPACVKSTVVVREAAALMAQRNIGAVVVCDDGQLVGILTERDLVRTIALGQHANEMSVANLMTPAPFSVTPNTLWLSAAELMRRHHIRHLPVVDQGKPVGMLSMRDLLEQRSNHLEQLVRERTAELTFTNALLLERERLMQAHLKIAARLQRQLLPDRPPELSTLAIALAYHPLDQVSGDYYDFATLPSGRLGILLADAAGHGIPAAFVSVMAKTAFHAYAQGIESPAAMLQLMNLRLADLMGSEHFLTMFYGVVERSTLLLTYALAGHPRPYRFSGTTGRVEKLDAEGPVIGLLPDAHFEERTVQLHIGDMVLIYTDGVTDCRNPAQDCFGHERLEAFLTNHGATPDPVALLDQELNRFRATEPFHDDVTCIGLCIRQ